jgi:hypothetical protein
MNKYISLSVRNNWVLFEELQCKGAKRTDISQLYVSF